MTSNDLFYRTKSPSHGGFSAWLRGLASTKNSVNADLHIRVFDDLAEIESQWRIFEKTAVASCYQRFDFVSAWFENIGRRNGYSPYIIVGSDRKNQLAFIWPMMLRRRYGYRSLSWPGGRHSNYNLGLYRRFWMKNLDETLIRNVFRAANKIIRFDAAHLINQPENWDGTKNPFSNLPHIPSPSFAYCIDLRQGYEHYLKTFRSPKFRKRLRWQERRLSASGKITYRRARTCEEAIEFLDAHFAQKTSRFLSMGKSNPFEERGLKSFLLDLATRNPEAANPSLELHALFLDDQFLAVYGGAASEGRFSALFNSIDIRYAKQVSVGDMLLARLARSCDERYLDGLDLGIGEAGYKEFWCNQSDRLFDTFITMSVIGFIPTTIATLARRAKRVIKQTPFLWRLAAKFV